ncbi:AbrB/MazE/SpoVT family DNA-binding domain-containing protein [Candidatus Fermentibacteria bacterium]|nr:AbrB/MazE/SpoVT family DNA-binding domain-containing protein [Candidatus Fermentibacteria bacterium]
MKTTVKKWGNSLALRIPKAISEDLNIEYNTEVEVMVKDGCLILRPRKANYSLEAMLAKITAENIHEEIDTGDRQGREEW